MRNKILYLLIYTLLASSCSKEKSVIVIIHPLQININGETSQLREQLKKTKYQSCIRKQF